MFRFKLTLIVLTFSLLTACGREDASSKPDYTQGNTPATDATAKTNAAVVKALPFDDTRDFDNARRGLIASPEKLIVKSERSGQVIWDQHRYAFEQGEAPNSVNPSLWRQAQLNAIHGLFKVSDRIYQLRGFDLSNMSLIEGDTGWIVIDPLTTKETAATAWAFAMQHLDNKPIVAVLFTHSHVDHFGGIAGLLEAAESTGGIANNMRIIAPGGFTDEATSENVMAGVAMQRRASFQYGRPLERSDRGHVDMGLGKEVPFGGSIGFAEPTEIVDKTGTELDIDGLRFVFQYTPESEAPAEFTFYLPDLKAFCGAEVVAHNLHNVYTLRGAKVRDALRWSDYIHEMTRLFSDAEVYFASHHWPIWGNDNIIKFLKGLRDTYKYIHDQALRLANRGYRPQEIAERLELPPSLAQTFANRGYYGTVRHNAKAVYQFYFGWYDGNPANLNPLPRVDAAEKYIDAMGGTNAVLEKAEAAFDDGEYRWAAELLNHLVYAQPGNKEARMQLAAVYDQLGYQSESGPWRDVYLTGAYELRHGKSEFGADMTGAIDLLRAIPLHKFFAAMASNLKAEDAIGEELAVNFVFTDKGQAYHLWIENAVLHSEPHTDQQADVTLNVTHELFLKMVTGEAGVKDLLLSDELNVDGSRLKLIKFFGLLDPADGKFPIVTSAAQD